ncbi:hypothetical protein RJ45_01015 [Photobacterium gaetbulicola]|uniref:Uncharacterized protein n=1 Tax=Photobacterium gaetbulicola TaxID=1295392 RepID=A0A0B9G9N3_9GAMM|nr:hypothetical protein [Photobacterium gaetbulicola]KHT65448.1 hypothetical protein RJ45_01015 [Photobacterium gaetbulicola]
MNVHKELYKLFYQAERLSRAIHLGRYHGAKCPLDSSQDAIRMAYRYGLDGIDVDDLFKAQATATTVMVCRRKPEFQQSQRLLDAMAKREEAVA